MIGAQTKPLLQTSNLRHWSRNVYQQLQSQPNVIMFLFVWNTSHCLRKYWHQSYTKEWLDNWYDKFIHSTVQQNKDTCSIDANLQLESLSNTGLNMILISMQTSSLFQSWPQLELGILLHNHFLWKNVKWAATFCKKNQYSLEKLQLMREQSSAY